ncbi:hypothetical protein TCAL_08246 [Tigriopus californicus]|uniref:DnaJ homolog subfamily B member 9 n=1 Tax=Tigriopus californicus TaxID=6832 RepID=A0A553NZA2_TIGCA|nr:uncharacterized protein LOC131886196 [Tigriopus californicus]TRY70773.1 hypothetical protein TCAL_08246 [Tigriopus californicus]|eukprot:TCALIF_08246-PA protein Name:"Similar to dnaJ Chaperone protein DnaJ (Picrophilus torridus (strain ATCC 700027 / DSM 9790 / JCM 10055 / NBRC 100828))" AED:0.00 eAED:0.00 QI:57/1/1/1/1/1/3/149/385
MIFSWARRRTTWTSPCLWPVHKISSSSTQSPRVASPKSLYDVLGVSKDATPQDIKSAFYDLSKKFHPDLNPGQADEKFRELASAYEVLSNSESRQQYDTQRKLDAHRPTPGRPAYPGGKRDPADYQNRASRRVRSDFKPDFGRKVDVDMSPERMARAWEAYKLRWEKDAARRRELDEMKLKFRMDWDKLRANQYENMPIEELERLREDMRMLRFGARVRQAQNCPKANHTTSEAHPKADKFQAAYETLKATRDGRADRQPSASNSEEPQASSQDPKDPLSTGSTERFKATEVKQIWEESQQKWDRIKKEYANSQFFSDNTGSSQLSGEFRSHGYVISRRVVIGIVIFFCLLTSSEKALDNEVVQSWVFSHRPHHDSKESVAPKKS